MLQRVEMTPTSDAAVASTLPPSSGPSAAPPRPTALAPAAEPAVVATAKTKATKEAVAAAEPAVTATAKTKATPTRITKEAVASLSLHFASTSWPLNKALPRGKLSKELAAIQLEYGLAKSQVARQLKNFKDKKYRLKDIVLSQSPEQIKEVLEEGIGMEYSEFVCSVLTSLCEAERDLGNRDLNNYSSIIGEFPSVAIDLLHAFATDGSLCLSVLVQLVEGFTIIASEEFPKSIARLPDADLEFQVRCRQQKKVFIAQWIGHHESFLGAEAESFPVEKYRYFGSFLYDVLFDCWAFRSMEGERPPVTLPQKCLVGKYARPVVYYVSGWTMHSLSLAKTIGKAMRPLYARFAEQHSIGEKAALEKFMPVSLVQKRNHRSLLFCSPDYFNFICFVESVYLDNLTLEMLMGHPEGNIIQVIKSSILGSDLALQKFDRLCIDDEHQYSAEEKRLLLQYVMDRYANMRGTYFVKFLSGTRGASTTETQVASLATRTKVLSTVASSKAAAAAKSVTDQELWNSVGDSVVHHSIEFDNLEAHSC
jgi:hypothetical protein